MTQPAAPGRSEAVAAGVAGRGRLVVAAVVVVLGAAFVAHGAAWIGGGFGYSLDGFNGAVWGQGARALTDDPIGSRLGGVQPDGHRYANHPPLTVWSAGVLSAASGDSPVAVRLPAVAASVLALAVLAVLLRDAGVSPAGTVVGLAAGATCSMFLAFGAMLDTPVVSLPVGLAALAAAQRAWQRRPPPGAVVVALAALAALAGWQALVLVAVAAALVALVDRGAAARIAAGGTAGLALTAAWVVWVHASLRPLLDQAGFRAGGAGTRVPWLTAQRQHLGDVYGPMLLAVVAAGLVVAVLPARGRTPAPGRAGALLEGTRPLLLVLALTVVTYTVGFRNGSAVHPYWTFWGVALVVVAVAGLADRAAGALSRGTASGAVVTAAGVVVAVAVAAAGLARDSAAERAVRRGLDLVPVLDAAPDAPEPTDVALAAYDLPDTLPWAEHAVDGRAVHADTPEELRALPPDLPVVVVTARGPSEDLRRRATAVEGRFVLVPAAELADHLDR